MFTPISNPYIVGNPIKTSEMFFGREDDFDFIKRKLESGQKSYVIVLCGERRSGKTSILFQILSGRLGTSFIPILIDMQAMAGLKNEREFFEKFANETLKCINDEIDIDAFFKKSDSSYKGFSAFLQEINKRNPQKHILFLVDEYELIEAKISEGSLNENLIPYLAGLLENDQNISFLFTGSTNLEDRDTDLWQILFAKSLFRNVSYLSRDDTLRLITEPVKDKLKYETEVLNVIFRLTWGQPFYTQVVCQYIVDYVNGKELNQILLEDLEVVISEILENPLPQMIYFWNNLSDDKKLVLSLLSELLVKPDQRIKAEEIISESNQRKFGLELSVKSVNMTLESLYHLQYVSKSSSGFNFQMDLFRRWIKRDHAIWRVMKEVSALGQASSVVDQVYKNETSPASQKSFKWLIPISVIIIAVILGAWWLLKPSSELSVQKKQSGSEEQSITDKPSIGKQKIETSPIVENTIQKKTASKKEKIKSGKSPIKIKKRPATSTDKRSSNRSKSKAETKTENNMKQKALAAKQIWQQTLGQANKKQIDMTGNEYVIQAMQKEGSADLFLKQNNFIKSARDFNEATSLLNKALTEHSENLSLLKSESATQRNNLQKIKQKLTEPMHKLNLYKSAIKEDNDAEELLANGQYKPAIQKFKKAASAYTQLIILYKKEKKSIVNTINEYLSAIQNESIVQMKQYHANFTPQLEKDWQTLFDFTKNLKISHQYKTYNFDDKKAQVQIDVNLDFGGTNKPKQNHWQIDLDKSATFWIITNIREGSQ